MNQIEISPGGIQALSNNVQNLSTEVNSAEESMAIVVNGDTAPKAISKGQYLFIKNHSTLATGGYHATAAIASGANVAGKVSADTDGIVNALKNEMTIQAVTFTPVTGVKTIGTQGLYTYGKVFFGTLWIGITDSSKKAVSSTLGFFNVQVGGEYRLFGFDGNNHVLGTFRLYGTGTQESVLKVDNNYALTSGCNEPRIMVTGYIY